jgi:hypothetical protein
MVLLNENEPPSEEKVLRNAENGGKILQQNTVE